MAKKKTGRPLRKFTDEQKRSIERMALDNCHLDTIAMALSVPKQTLVRRFGTFIAQKRAKGRTDLRRTQRKLAAKNPAMAIFLGKNELSQTDKREETHNVTGDLAKFLETLAHGSVQCPSEREDTG